MRNILLILMMGLNITWSQMISYHSDSTGEIMGYLSKPKTNAALPGIILIHEWWGLNQDIKNKADEFAKKGYVDDAKMTLARGKMGILPTGSIPIDNPVGAVPAVISKVKERYPLSKLG